jgi:hypothetical protein
MSGLITLRKATSKKKESMTSSQFKYKDFKGIHQMEIKGQDVLTQILEEKEFEFEIYTPKHSCIYITYINLNV